jgi:Cyclin, N-terminal domain
VVPSEINDSVTHLLFHSHLSVAATLWAKRPIKVPYFRKRCTSPYMSWTASSAWQVSISPIFYEQLLCTKGFCAAFMCLQSGFVIFWRKDLGAKAAHKMLVTLTPGRKVTTKNLQLVGIASLLIASKYEEILTPSIGECSCREY